MRADRLLSLLMLLQSRGRMTARELAEQLEVSERTIYRDMEALGIAGIPVCAERGPGGGCFLIDGYQTKLTGLNEAEVRALFLFKLARPLADLGLNKALEDAMLKLSAALPAEQRGDAEQVRQRIHLDMEDWSRNEPPVPHLQTIQEAIWHDRKLLISYDEGCKLCQDHLIEPYGLVSKANTWYVVAAVAGEQRVFCVSHIHAAVPSEEHFTRAVSFDLSSFWTTYRAQLAQRTEKPSASGVGYTRYAAHSMAHSKKTPPIAKNIVNRRAFPSQKKEFLKTQNGRSQQKKRNSWLLKKEKMSLPLKKTNYAALSFVA